MRNLICSDLMARGIDTTTDWVINYDSSIAARQYVHRVGRTARAGRPGTAVSIVEASEDKFWWNQIGGKKIGRSRPVARSTLLAQNDTDSPAGETLDAAVDKELQQLYDDALKLLTGDGE